MTDDAPVQFTFRPWRPEHESWEVFLVELETAYAQYLERYRQGRGTDPEAAESDPASERDGELTPPPS
jgi:hypothetical protein